MTHTGNHTGLLFFKCKLLSIVIMLGTGLYHNKVTFILAHSKSKS